MNSLNPTDAFNNSFDFFSSLQPNFFPSLTSSYMPKFHPDMLMSDMNLGKRQVQPLEDLQQAGNKKLKTQTNAGQSKAQVPNSLTMSDPAVIKKRQKYEAELQLTNANLTQMMMTQFAQAEIQSLRMVQKNLSEKFAQPEANDCVKIEICLKEEQIKDCGFSPKIEKHKFKIIADTPNDYQSEVTRDGSPSNNACEKVGVGEPVLFEMTKAFPAWDLQSIFGYLKSNKSMEDYRLDRNNLRDKKKRSRENNNKNKKSKKDAAAVKKSIL